MEEEFELIMRYKELKSIGQICKDLKIDYPNLSRKKTTKENIKQVSNEIKKEIIMIYNDLILNEVLK